MFRAFFPYFLYLFLFNFITVMIIISFGNEIMTLTAIESSVFPLIAYFQV
jgi:hypothetical protein